MAEYYLNAPLCDEDVTKLKVGDTVYISGECFTCRSRLQKYIFDEGHTLPFSTDSRNVLIHNGPIVVKENGKWRLVSFMPTSSIRFEKWGAKSVENWNLKMIVGKTTMGKVILYIWSIPTPENNIGGSSFDTVARLGAKISQSCDPIVVNEPAALCNSNSTKEPDIAIFNQAIAYSDSEEPFSAITIIEFKKFMLNYSCIRNFIFCVVNNSISLKTWFV